MGCLEVFEFCSLFSPKMSLALTAWASIEALVQDIERAAAITLKECSREQGLVLASHVRLFADEVCWK